MADKQEIEKKLTSLEALAAGIIYECQQTRKLLEADVSTSTDASLSKIAMEARTELRAKVLKSCK